MSLTLYEVLQQNADILESSLFEGQWGVVAARLVFLGLKPALGSLVQVVVMSGNCCRE